MNNKKCVRDFISRCVYIYSALFLCLRELYPLKFAFIKSMKNLSWLAKEYHEGCLERFNFYVLRRGWSKKFFQYCIENEKLGLLTKILNSKMKQNYVVEITRQNWGSIFSFSIFFNLWKIDTFSLLASGFHLIYNGLIF